MLKNFLKNKTQVENLPGILHLKNLFYSYPCMIIAAGPGLDDTINLVKENEDKFIIIAADTAVRACHRHGLKPDFILLMDAQYWNYLHIAGLDISSSVLITESSVYPAVFRIKTAATLLCTSMFPLAQYIEKAVGDKGQLTTGGSVATAAWDFARFLGIKEIIAAGLDLAFPNHQTHFSGSRFEEDGAVYSSRFAPSETASHRSIYAARPEWKDGYSGKVLTDARLQMYAWWFESKLAQFPDIKTYNLMPEGLKIPNMPPLLKEDFFKKAENAACFAPLKKERIAGVLNSRAVPSVGQNGTMKAVLCNLKNDLMQAEKLSREGVDICSFLLKKHQHLSAADIAKKAERLSHIDTALFKNETNKIIGFNLLLNENTAFARTEDGNLFVKTYKDSLAVYENIENSIAAVLKSLP